MTERRTVAAGILPRKGRSLSSRSCYPPQRIMNSVYRSVFVVLGGALVACSLPACGADQDFAPGFSTVAGVQDAAGVEDAARDAEASISDAREDRRPPPDANLSGPPYPIVLHHGFSGWKDVQALNIAYFYGVAEALANAGETQVFETQVDPYRSTEVRGDQLAAQIDQILADTGKDKVNVIGHSQGGLDARYVISTLGYGDRIASLTSISTPHRGTRIAQALLKTVPDWSDPLINAIAGLIGKSLFDIDSDQDMRESLKSMSEDYVQLVFNPANPNDSRVGYYSYAGRSNDANGVPDCDGSWIPGDPSVVDHIDPLLALTGAYLKKPGEGIKCHNDNCANDGVVTVQSARWGLFMGCVPADHFDEVGQIKKEQPNAESGYSQRQFYTDVVARMRARGF